ncbi:MAG: amidohydrolase family protein, partial [Clostridia bacterium]|nr:amidohydrolase family protein [Clostridia bacterium]
MLDLLIRNGTVIDGTGSAAFVGNVAVNDGKITVTNENFPAKRVIDAAGNCVAPGFIDAHSHGDGVLGTESGRLFKTPQGVTTEICGNCGGTRLAVYNNGDPIVEKADFGTFEKMLDYADMKKKTANIRFYMGHGTLRRAVMGIEDKKPTSAEMDKMKALLEEYMQCGCAGVTSGLGYVPGCFADTEELIELAKVSAKYGGFYASHMRNE